MTTAVKQPMRGSLCSNHHPEYGCPPLYPVLGYCRTIDAQQSCQSSTISVSIAGVTKGAATKMHCIMQEMIADSDHKHVITMQVCYAHIKHAAMVAEDSPIGFGRKNPPDTFAS